MMPPAPLSRRRFLRIAAAHAAGVLIAGRHGLLQAAPPRDGARLHRWQGIALGTAVSIDLFSPDEALARTALQDCRREMVRLESIFSLYDQHSALGRLNTAGCLPEAPPELLELLAIARQLWERSNGAFDVSVQPVCELLAQRGGVVPRGELQAAVALVDGRAITCDSAGVRLERAGMKLTLNGLAQGYITDRVAELLQQRGFSNTLVDLGEKRALGAHPDGRAWKVGVEAPDEPGALAGVIDLRGRALATSGGYGGRLPGQDRHHLVDARTGDSRHDFASVTVVAPTATLADGLSTCLAVLPAAKLPGFLRGFADVDVHVVGRPGDPLRRLAT